MRTMSILSGILAALMPVAMIASYVQGKQDGFKSAYIVARIKYQPIPKPRHREREPFARPNADADVDFGHMVRDPVAWQIAESDYRKSVICDLHPKIGLFADKNGAHVHCPEELNGGGYRDGKFVYLKNVAQ